VKAHLNPRALNLVIKLATIHVSVNSQRLYTSLFTIMVANEKKTDKQTKQKLN